MPNEIEKDIFRTIAYFAFFQYPVTQFEIYKWLMMPEKSYSFFDVCNSLEESVWLREKTDRYLGFYTIQNSAQLVAKRHEKFLNAIEKRKKLKKVINY
ncbi:hypothetical protein KJ766_03310, partial [Patescibacteria group bacterium]|nr:hypothetical protein [Patescibacteria group bacterium]